MSVRERYGWLEGVEDFLLLGGVCLAIPAALAVIGAPIYLVAWAVAKLVGP
jgi:hypothetical protein